MYFLFLDDERRPTDVKWQELPLGPWIIVRDYNQFVDCIVRNGLPNHISFDHDLGDEHYPTAPLKGNEIIEYDTFIQKTGYHCARWLIDYCIDNKLKLPNWGVHSLNPVGRKNIQQLLGNFATFQANESV